MDVVSLFSSLSGFGSLLGSILNGNGKAVSELIDSGIDSLFNGGFLSGGSLSVVFASGEREHAGNS